jgi:hypothetical protein
MKELDTVSAKALMAEYKAEKNKSDDAPAETKASSDDKKPELALAFDAMDK